MRRINTQTGREVLMSGETWDCVVKRGDAKYYIEPPLIHIGTGPSNRVCLMMNENGIGDDIHTLPAIKQKIADGFDVTVVARQFTRPMFEKLGCAFIPCEEAQVGFMKEALPKYGKLYSLRMWCIDHDEETKGHVFLTRFEQFAKKIDTKLPDDFDFKAYIA